MINRIITLLSILSSILAIAFIVLLFSLYRGFNPFGLQGGNPATVQVEKQMPTSTPPTLVSTSTSTPTAATPTTTVKINLQSVKSTPPVLKKSVKTSPVVSTPAPLVVEKPVATTTTVISNTTSSNDSGTPSKSGALNQKAILDIVNIERAKAGLAPLGFNIRLSAIAEGKAVDMINKQYFAHVSPTGVNVAQLAKTYGYEYIFLGENLALGDFVSSEEVMTGWMNSPGHRANILNKNYTEIGISALEGNYQGRTVWYAVQEFGAPLSLCPAPDSQLEALIASEEGDIQTIERKINAIRTSLEQAGDNQSVYNSLVEQHNALVDSYNTLVVTTKANIAAFNNSVSIFNECIGANSSSTPTH